MTDSSMSYVARARRDWIPIDRWSVSRMNGDDCGLERTRNIYVDHTRHITTI